MADTVQLLSVFHVQRQNMVLGQLQPFGVTNEAILKAFGTVPREDFVPKAKKDVAYADSNGLLLDPAVHGKWLQAANIESTDKVLALGDPSGYGTAILGQLTKHVATTLADKTKFDVVVVHQAVHDIASLTEYMSTLKPLGRLLAFCQGQALIFERFDDICVPRVLFDAFVPCVAPAKSAFVF